MVDQSNIRITLSAAPHAELRNEICEHKGTGHPDTICDGVVEAVSRALCAAYLQAYGEIRHHNVDKALLIGGQSEPRFGGGEIQTKMRLIVAGRADPLPGMTDLSPVVYTAAREYLAAKLRCSVDLFIIESAVRSGSPNLRRVIPTASSITVANDTSFGVGFAPYSQLERTVLNVASLLESESFRATFPMAGDDFKIMGVRFDKQIILTMALAVKDQHVESCQHYFSTKDAMVKWLHDHVDADNPVVLRVNALDDIASLDEAGIYLTVSGLSAEHGDDGQVGRGNRVSRLITPSRPMSLEAAAGKNPVSHVGKIYNVMALRLANELIAQVPDIDEAEVQIVSCIGQPIDSPQLVDIRVAPKAMMLSEKTSEQIREIARIQFSQVKEVTQQLVLGNIPLF